MPNPNRFPMMVGRIQFDTFRAHGICTANMDIIQMLPLSGEPLPVPEVLPPCQCERCRAEYQGHA